MASLANALYCGRVMRVEKRFYPFDAIAFSKHDSRHAQAVVEIKIRTCTSSHYKTYMISLDKLCRGVQMADVMRCEFVIAVRWIDCFGLWSYSDHAIEKPHIEFGGRTDRGDSQDVEPVVHIPISQFKKFRSE